MKPNTLLVATLVCMSSFIGNAEIILFDYDENGNRIWCSRTINYIATPEKMIIDAHTDLLSDKTLTISIDGDIIKVDIPEFKTEDNGTKWTWGLLTSFVGNQVAHWYNFVGKVDGVTNLNGVLALSGALSGENGMTIGHYSLGPKNYRADWRDHLFVHEYGHYIQSQRWGSLFLPVIGTTSLISTQTDHHLKNWTETTASRLGAKHFDKKYGRGHKNYVAGSDQFFDRVRFHSGYNTLYVNPRFDNKFVYGGGQRENIRNMNSKFNGDAYPL